MLDLSGYTPEQLKELQKQLTELTKPETKPRKARKLPKILKSDQVDKLLAAINTDTDRGIRQAAIILSMLRSALRVSEVTNLTVADVDLIKGSLYLQLAKGSKDRIVPIGPELIHALQAWNEIRPDSEWFFCSRKGTQLFQRNIRETCYELSKKAGIWIQDGKERKLFHPHNLRHTAATSWLNAGMSLVDIQTLLGHESLATSEIYLHCDNVALDRKIKALG
jgi:integrase/recombinase XerD